MGTTWSSSHTRHPRTHASPVKTVDVHVKKMKEPVIRNIAKRPFQGGQSGSEEREDTVIPDRHSNGVQWSRGQSGGSPPPVAGDLVLVTNGSEQPIAWGVHNSLSMFAVPIMQTEDEARRLSKGVYKLDRVPVATYACKVQGPRVKHLF